MILFASQRKRLTIMGICFLVLLVVSYFLPIVSQKIIDEGFGKENYFFVIFYALAEFVLFLLNSIVTIMQEKERLAISKNLQFKLNSEAFEHLMNINVSYYNENNPSKIQQTLELDINNIVGIMERDVIDLISDFFLACGCGISLIHINWRLALMALLYAPMKYGITMYLSNKNINHVKSYVREKQICDSYYGDMLKGIRVIRMFRLEQDKKKRYDDLFQKKTAEEYSSNMMSVYNNQIQNIMLAFLNLMVYIVAGILYFKGQITVGEIVAFTVFVIQLVTPLSGLANLIYGAYAIFPSIERYFTFMDLPEEKEGNKKEIMGGDIIFKNVSFKYDNIQVHSNVNLVIPEGKSTAILGKNGSGKSTIVNLILRMYRPNSGEILLGTTNIQEYDLQSYRDNISVVDQNIFLFNDTIEYNLTLGKKYNDDNINNIIDSVGLRATIQQKGMNYIVGENGSNLSGGQKQKIALARALLCEKKIVILDEATSNIDTESIRMIKNYIRNIRSNSTLIMITHDVEMLELFDVIYEIKDEGIKRIDYCNC